MTKATTNQTVKALIDIAVKLFNPSVIEIYAPGGDNEDEETAQTKRTLRENLTIDPSDTLQIAQFKIDIYYFLCEKIPHHSAPLSTYPINPDKTRNHLHLYYKPTQKGKKIFLPNGRIRPAPYIDFSIPHYVGPRRPILAKYTYGPWAIKAEFSDKSYILLHTNTEEEGIKIVLELCKFVDPKYQPKDGMKSKDLKISKPNARTLEFQLNGIKVKPYQIEYYKFGEDTWDWKEIL
jgi:hypothetical protein